MSYYTPEMAKFVYKLRKNGCGWEDIAIEFENKFGVRKSHDSLRISTKKLISEKSLKKGVAKPDRELPEYLVYKPKKLIKPGKSSKFGTALIIPDTHMPYHDKRAYELMIQIAKDEYKAGKLKEIVILGDFADFYAVNSHGKHPAFTQVLVDEISLVIKELERLAQLFPKAKRVFLQGNHEYRLERYIYNNAPDLFGIVDTKSILQLDKLGYELVKYGANQKYAVLGSKLYARHEPIGTGAHAASSTVDKAGCSMIFGHVHKIQQYRKVFIDGADHMAACVGWLGDKNHPVMGYLKNHAQWQHGMALVHVLENRNFFIDIKHFIDYTTHHNGKIYKG